LFLVALGVFFPIYLNTLHGIRTVESEGGLSAHLIGLEDQPTRNAVF
jgi:ABC-type nitrate/sulfonate/bicarbonate transport system permease component